MDVNVWGVARVTTAMLPLMRHTGGRIVVMASGLGRIMQPSRSPYGKIIKAHGRGWRDRTMKFMA